jgi:hypothetical protein
VAPSNGSNFGGTVNFSCPNPPSGFSCGSIRPASAELAVRRP